MARFEPIGDYRPSRDEIDTLIRRAAEHPLGADFLRKGALDAVAATFQVHAFVVDAARAHMQTPPPEVNIRAGVAVPRIS